MLLAFGLAVCCVWILVELRSSNPLIDMTMMRVRGVWTANLAAFLVGAGLYAWFLLLPQLAQLPRSTGFGYGASVVIAGLYLLPCAIGMGTLGSLAGRVERRFGSRRALVAGAAVSAVACGWLTFTSRHPYDLLISSMLLGIGIGLAFAALGNLIVQAVPPQQTGVASGMNTVLRTLGGALGGQIAATFVAASTLRGLPAQTGFTATFGMATVFLTACAAVALLVPAPLPRPGWVARQQGLEQMTGRHRSPGAVRRERDDLLEGCGARFCHPRGRTASGAPGTRRPAGRWAGSARGCWAGRRSPATGSRWRRIAAWSARWRRCSRPGSRRTRSSTRRSP